MNDVLGYLLVIEIFALGHCLTNSWNDLVSGLWHDFLDEHLLKVIRVYEGPRFDIESQRACRGSARWELQAVNTRFPKAHRSQLTVMPPHPLFSLELNFSLVIELFFGGFKAFVQGLADHFPGVSVLFFFPS
jgi:hypothetical protein